MGVSKLLQGIGFVVTQGINAGARFGQRVHATLQLHQLRTTGRSPDSGSKEHEYCSCVASVLVQIKRLAFNVDAANVGHAASDRRAGWEVAAGVGSWAGPRTDRSDETIVIPPAARSFFAPRFPFHAHTRRRYFGNNKVNCSRIVQSAPYFGFSTL